MNKVYVEPSDMFQTWDCKDTFDIHSQKGLNHQFLEMFSFLFQNTEILDLTLKINMDIVCDTFINWYMLRYVFDTFIDTFVLSEIKKKVICYF